MSLKDTNLGSNLAICIKNISNLYSQRIFNDMKQFLVCNANFIIIQ